MEIHRLVDQCKDCGRGRSAVYRLDCAYHIGYKKPALIQRKDAAGNTLLHVAAMHSAAQVIKEGIAYFEKSYYPMRIVSAAAFAGRMDLAKEAVTKVPLEELKVCRSDPKPGAESGPLQAALGWPTLARGGPDEIARTKEMLDLLLNAFKGIERDKCGSSPLTLAAPNPELLEWLLDKN